MMGSERDKNVRVLKEPLIHANMNRRNTQNQKNTADTNADDENKDSSEQRRDYDQKRFTTMFVLTGGFFIAELVTAMITGSLAMMSDAMHMLSDFVALLVGY